MMYFFDTSFPDVNFIRRPASRATSVKVTGNGRPEGAPRTAGAALCVAGPCAPAKSPSIAARRSIARHIIKTIVIPGQRQRTTALGVKQKGKVNDYVNDIDSLTQL